MGRMKMMILNTAAYDNLKPTSHNQYGLMHKRIKAEQASELITEPCLPSPSPKTRQVNINADRNTDGWAPARKLNSHKPVIINKG